jgi:RNA polymerase sigma-70 factor (sigma-E family)
VKAADEAAYRDYVVARMDALRRTAYLLCRNWHTADDLVATTLTKLYRKWHVAGRVANVDAYVRAILVNVWADERRRPWRREVSTDALPEYTGDQPPGHDEHGLLAYLGTIAPRFRAVLVLRFYCDLSIEETAEALGIAAGTVKSQTARGLAAMRAALTESGVRR